MLLCDIDSTVVESVRELLIFFIDTFQTYYYALTILNTVKRETNKKKSVKEMLLFEVTRSLRWLIVKIATV